MSIILNTHGGSKNFAYALAKLVDGAETLSIAVSYIQVGGWEALKKSAKSLSLPRMRIVCTDQFGITQPAAVRGALESDVKIRNYAGVGVYHPKVYLAHGRNGRPTRFLVGSANLSASAFSTSIEAGIVGEDRNSLVVLSKWFDNLFEKDSEAFTKQRLADMDAAWRIAAAARIRTRLRLHEGIIGKKFATVPLDAEDVDAIDDIFSTVRPPIGLLNFDYARNYVRSISLARKLLRDDPPTDSKTKSEFKLLGFMRGDDYTDLGREAASASSEENFARVWCQWLKRVPDAELQEINPRLVAGKHALAQFWRLPEQVREYFLLNVRLRKERGLVQTIELLCNAGEEVDSLSLEEIRKLSALLESKDLPPRLRAEISEYVSNKGARGWDSDDRRLLISAWRKA